MSPKEPPYGPCQNQREEECGDTNARRRIVRSEGHEDDMEPPPEIGTEVGDNRLRGPGERRIEEPLFGVLGRVAQVVERVRVSDARSQREVSRQNQADDGRCRKQRPSVHHETGFSPSHRSHHWSVEYRRWR